MVMRYVNYISVKVPKNKFKDRSRSRYIGVPEENRKDASETATDNCRELKKKSNLERKS